eukprot:TRINITY_DN9838_c0_g1_i1.p1 TRINITY_DN9838_c0_g1~~TRINITY_DN9838_c0_g1_i1.p1  ORF type:complete len:215 (+),score=10.03 TRINITY_DN9838_c0_g1_i1:68-712(+)
MQLYIPIAAHLSILFLSAAGNCSNGSSSCPPPTCSDLEYPVINQTANVSKDLCCPTYACARNETAICLNLRRLSNESKPSCDKCSRLVIHREADFEAGRCFAEYTCEQDLFQPCCHFPFEKCNTTIPSCPTHYSQCFSHRLVEAADFSKGRCCPKYECVAAQECVCGLAQADCTSAEDFGRENCGNNNPYRVRIKTPARYDIGRCCPKHVCRSQ